MSESIDTNSFHDSLQQAPDYMARINALPSPDEFETRLTTDFWETITQSTSPPQIFNYAEIPAEGQALIGRDDSSDAISEHPWWLATFDWTASFAGEEITLRGDGLDQFGEHFDRERTTLHRPKIRDEYDFISPVDVVKILQEIRAELSEIEANESSSMPRLPDELFCIKNNVLYMTDLFNDWIDELSTLLPAIGPTPTAVYLAHTGTEAESGADVLFDELYDTMSAFGLFKTSQGSNSAVRQFTSLLEIEMLFDRVIPADSQFDTLNPLEFQLYRTAFSVLNTDDEYIQKLYNQVLRSDPGHLEQGERGRFTRVACGTPVILTPSNQPRLMTLQTYAQSTNNTGYKDYNDRRRDIKRLYEIIVEG